MHYDKFDARHPYSIGSVSFVISMSSEHLPLLYNMIMKIHNKTARCMITFGKLRDKDGDPDT